MAKTRSEYIEINRMSRNALCKKISALADRAPDAKIAASLHKLDESLLNSEPVGTADGTKSVKECDDEILEMLVHLENQFRINSKSANVTAYIDRIDMLIARRMLCH